MQLSYWEKNTWFNNPDVLIVGSGIVGLNAALSLKLQNPTLSVLVIDRGFLPYGASTRNAGFACFGSISELLDDLTYMSEQQVFELLLRRWNGLKRLRSILKDPYLGYEGHGGFEVFTSEDDDSYEKCAEKIDYFNQKLFELTGEKNIYVNADNKIVDFGFKGVKHLLENRFEGQIDTGKMMHSLLNAARKHQVNVLNGIEVKNFMADDNGVAIETNQEFSFTCKKMLVTTDGFARQLLPHLAVEPARAQVLITEPIGNLKIKGTFHYDKGYYYFRNVGNKLLFGGGRNLNFDKERTVEFTLTEEVQHKLEQLLQEMILPGIDYKVEQRWSGIMGLGNSKTTIIQPVHKNTFCAVRMGGMGIAIGSLVGMEAADMILKEF